MERIKQILKQKVEADVFPESYTIKVLTAELTKDGFSVNRTLMNDLDRFGVQTGIVLVNDGADGMRIIIDESKTIRIALYNGLLNKNHPMHDIAAKKYQGKIILLDK